MLGPHASGHDTASFDGSILGSGKSFGVHSGSREKGTGYDITGSGRVSSRISTA